MDKNQIKIIQRLTLARTDLLKNLPFFGRLLFHLPIVIGNCDTAYTDMKKIVFSYDFVSNLSLEEIEFVLCHELLHCVLKHCIRGRNLNFKLYNLACDIVINSLILQTKGKTNFKVNSNYVMHIAPNGDEGRNYTAEEVYNMLLSKSDEEINELYKEISFDNHDMWLEISDADTELSDEWDSFIEECGKHSSSYSGIPLNLKRYVDSIARSPKVNWKQILHDFIQHNDSDYNFLVPDRRYSNEFIFPSFQNNASGERIEKVWFLADTSGSVSDEELSKIFNEIKGAIEQIENFSGYVSFFDAMVTEPAPFSTVYEFLKMVPVGGGGTSFKNIFKCLPTYFDELPRLIIIATDGYADFPRETEALEIPVIWLIVNSSVEPPWGEKIHID